MACRKAKIAFVTLQYHLEQDADFRRQAEEAKAHAIDLLHTKAFSRCVEGDVEPIHWQGVVVDYIRKYPERLTIEMLRAHMPATFKTPGSAQVNIATKGDILVLTEEQRTRIMAKRREALLAMPTTREGEDERQRKLAQESQVTTPDLTTPST